ncbi:MAG TPA: methyltransferase domain-containing protein [Planctomycetota bacterium]|nr:methyltransferase domain-containing protein [Planctomycetota bacterium]
MKTRSAEPELLDLETPPREEMVRVAGYLAFVNRWLGGTRAVAFHLREVKDSVTVLDVASGAADIPQDLARRFPNVHPVAFDRSEMMLSLAPGIDRVRGDVRWLPFRDRSVDYVLSTHFFHHLTDDQIVGALREFDRIARRGIIVNDLLRRRRAIFWIRLLTVFANRYVKVDGPRSVRKSFTLAEVEALARRAGLGWLRVRVHFGHRFTLAGERPG